eukprot:6193239-Pleurochrysis_carterae.AAC.1
MESRIKQQAVQADLKAKVVATKQKRSCERPITGRVLVSEGSPYLQTCETNVCWILMQYYVVECEQTCMEIRQDRHRQSTTCASRPLTSPPTASRHKRAPAVAAMMIAVT